MWTLLLGAGVCLYQCHIRASGGRDEVMSVFGYNYQSWSLFCSPYRYSFRHNNIQTDLSVKPISRRIGGVYDDDDNIINNND